MKYSKILQLCIVHAILMNNFIQPSGRDQTLQAIEQQAAIIEQILDIKPADKHLEQYELYKKSGADKPRFYVKETYFTDGSYLITKFDQNKVQAVESRLYETIADHCINTKLIAHQADGTCDLHELNRESGIIVSQKYLPERNTGTFFKPATQQGTFALFTLQDGSFAIRPAKRSIFGDTSKSSDDEDDNEDQDMQLTAEQRVERLVACAQKLHKERREINIIEIKEAV